MHVRERVQSWQAALDFSLAWWMDIYVAPP
jgi:hypothetical protein